MSNGKRCPRSTTPLRAKWVTSRSKDALATAVREDLTRNAEREADAEVRRRLLDDIAGANPFELPPCWVQRLVDAYAGAYQIPEADRQRFANEFRPVAESQVRRELIIETHRRARGACRQRSRGR